MSPQKHFLPSLTRSLNGRVIYAMSLVLVTIGTVGGFKALAQEEPKAQPVVTVSLVEHIAEQVAAVQIAKTAADLQREVSANQVWLDAKLSRIEGRLDGLNQIPEIGKRLKDMHSDIEILKIDAKTRQSHSKKH